MKFSLSKELRASGFSRQLRVLPLLIVVASFAFIVRVGDAALQMRSLSGSAFAEEAAVPASEPKEEAKKEEKEAPATPEKPEVAVPELPKAEDIAAKKPEEKVAGEEEPKTEKSEAEKSEAGTAPKEDAPKQDWQDASDADLDYSNIRKEVYEDLLQRRQQIEEKEKALGQREALVEAAQKELDKKYQELTSLRNEIQDLLSKQSEEEKARIASLVKIYEGMKPKDAARIFNTLDMDILIDVVSRMSERKSSPIIASMEADRARALTTLLAEQKKLPELPETKQ
jgi:flagellar motility protein MotE (MotC chaperone)